MGRMEKQSSAGLVERGRTRDLTAVAGAEEGCRGWRCRSLPMAGCCIAAWSLCGLCSQTQDRAGSDRMSYSGWGLLKRPSRSMLPPEAMLVSAVYVTVGGHAGLLPPSCADALGPYGCPWSVLPPDAMLASMLYVAAGGHVGARSLYYLLRP